MSDLRAKKTTYKSYPTENMKLAMQRIREGNLSVRAAARMYGIPRATLQDKVNGKTPLESTQGPNPVLTKAEELKLVDWAKGMAAIGYGRTQRELRFTVRKIMDSDGRPNPFKDNMPGRKWMKNFMKRHPDISMRMPENLGRERAAVTVGKIEAWFKECQNYMVESGKEEVFSDPHRLFNADEIGFPLAGKTQRVIAPKGAKNVYNQQTVPKNPQEQITVVGACNAAGQYVPPLMIFPGKRFAYNPLNAAPAGSSFAKSENGWINSEIFYEYITNHFHPFVQSLKVKFPIVLFVDGHASHINIETADFCAENDIILYCLPAHSSHLMQPLDVAVYRPVKAAWYNAVRDYTISHPCQVVTKQVFSSVFAMAWNEGTKSKNAVSGFRKCGLYPFNPSAVDTDKLQPSRVYPETPSTSSSVPAPTQSSTPTISTSSSSAKTALLALESTLSADMVALYHQRLNEGFDPDPMYTAWKTLYHASKLPPSPEPTTSAAETTPSVSPSKVVSSKSPLFRLKPTHISPSLDEHLRFPKRAEKQGKTKTKKKKLPHVISGDAFREMLREKKKKKREIEEAKEKRKRKREQKIREREGKKRKKVNKTLHRHHPDVTTDDDLD